MRWWSPRIVALPVVAWMLALGVGSTVHALDGASIAAPRFSIAGRSDAGGPPAFTLLEPQWLLPPPESLEASDAERADQMLHDDDTATTAAAPAPAANGTLSYSLSDDLTADVDYRRVLLFERGDSQTAREDAARAFSTRGDRDVVDLNMSWRLAGNTLGLGYQLESARGGAATDLGLSRFFPGNQQAVHSLTLGVSRAWGASAPPVAVEPVVPLPLDVAVDASPTPAP